jgi:hypothetical protein
MTGQSISCIQSSHPHKQAAAAALPFLPNLQAGLMSSSFDLFTKRI